MNNNKVSRIITCALPYANGELHLGHVASTYLPADIFVKYLKLKGENIIFACGTDDFGTPILIKAEQEGKSPQDYVAYWYRRDKEDFEKLGIVFDIFHRTSSEDSIKLAQHFFRVLKEKGYIYKKKVYQYYCNNCNRFLPDRYVRGTCPYCKAENQYSDSCEACGRVIYEDEIINPKCSICGSVPIKKESEHYFFKLSVFGEEIKNWLLKNENLQNDVKKYVISWIDAGLQDWDITRDIPWGVPIENGKVLYGWFENHLCYISSVLKYCEDKSLDGKYVWNSSIIYHFIGKDIIYHHYLFLPAIRLGEGEFKLPDFIPVRGHLLLEGKKISKSRGWYISLREFLEKYQADYLRYYLTRIISYSQADANFEWNSFKEIVNSELIENIGNFIYRALSFIWNKFNGFVPSPKEFDIIDKEFLERMKNLSFDVEKYFESLEFEKAIKLILDFSSSCNKYFQEKEPWKGSGDTCLYLSLNAVALLCNLLYPFIPFSCEKIKEQLNLENLFWPDLTKNLIISEGHRINKPYPIFSKI
ncbi:MAG: methionine--tRNA ligase [Candidatus Aenigmatarchaeota archaeon]